VSVRRRIICHARDSVHDTSVTGAATKIAAHVSSNGVECQLFVSCNHVARGNEHARRAVTTLQSMFFGKSLAEGFHEGIVVESLDRLDVCSVTGNGIGDAGSTDFTIDQYGAGATDAVLASDMCPG
jgi:hypothetical protein